MYVCVGFVMCGCFGHMYTCIYCVLNCLYCAFCIVSSMYIYSYLLCLLLPPSDNSIAGDQPFNATHITTTLVIRGLLPCLYA